MNDSNPLDPARNLLFGLLAIQNGVIDRHALLAAIGSWTLEKSRPIGDILVTHGAISTERLAIIDGLVTLHLEMHDNTPEKSLAALAPIGTIREDLETFIDSDTTKSLALVTVDRSLEDDPFATRAPSIGTPTANASFATHSDSFGTPTSSGVRFEILRPLNKGGMGVVSIALDKELDRSIALKEIREAAADDAGYRARFLTEAEITGKLEHPGIIPIYGLGTNADGRPFYAMRLIRGDKTGSLMDAIKAFHGKNDATGRIVEFRGLLRRFLDVCNALAYAHSRGVVHRDLKPENILLGPYGETLVVDWGLAKAADHDDIVISPDSDQIRLKLSGGDSSVTLDGSSIGTPEYAPPEQMTGDLANIGPRSDVYGLGAILYCLMTGTAPFARKGIHLGALIEKIRVGDFPRPRQIRPDIEKPIEAICLKAMACDPAGRYESVSGLVADLEHYLADEPTEAYLDPWTTRARRWARKNRTAVTSFAAALIVILVALSVGIVIVGSLNRQLDNSNTKLNQANTKLASALASEKTARNLAEERKMLADENFTLALDAVKAQVFDIYEQLQNRPGTRDLREKLQKSATDRLKMLIERTTNRTIVDRTAMTAHINLGDIYLRIDLKPTLARDEYEKAYEITKKLLGITPKDPQLQRDITYSYERLGNIALQTGKTAIAQELYQKCMSVRLVLAEANPKDPQAQNDLLVSLNKLGDVMLQTGDPTKSLEFYQKGLEVAVKLEKASPKAAQTRRDLLISYDRMGDAFLQSGDTSKVFSFYQKSREIAVALVKDDPDNTRAQSDLSIAYSKLGDVFVKTGQTAKAIESYQQGMVVREALISADPMDFQSRRDLSVSYNKLGDLSMRNGQAAKARDYFQKGLALREVLAKSDVNDTQAQRDLSIAYERLGDLSRVTGENAKAHDYYQKGQAVTETLAKADPNDSQAKRDLSIYYNKLGDMSLSAGDTAKAQDYYRKDLEVSDALAKANPNDAQAQRDLSICHDRLGNVSLQKGDLTKAQESYREALRVRQAIVEADPKNSQAKRDLMISYSKIGDVSLQKGETDAARKSFEKALEACVSLAKSDPDNLQAQSDLGISYNTLGDLLLQSGEIAKALDLYALSHAVSKQLAETDPSNAEAKRGLLIFSLNQGLASVVQGKPAPLDNAEKLALARWAHLKKLHATSARLYAQTFEADPKLGEERNGQPRYLAASSAAMASLGQGFDVPKPDEAAKAKLRAQALTWLNAELSAWDQFAAGLALQNRPAFAKILGKWRDDPNLAEVRDPASLAKLPEAERKDWQALWAGFDAMLTKLAEK